MQPHVVTWDVTQHRYKNVGGYSGWKNVQSTHECTTRIKCAAVSFRGRTQNPFTLRLHARCFIHTLIHNESMEFHAANFVSTVVRFVAREHNCGFMNRAALFLFGKRTVCHMIGDMREKTLNFGHPLHQHIRWNNNQCALAVH